MHLFLNVIQFLSFNFYSCKLRLFGKKEGEVDPEQEDEIIYKDDSKKTKYINLKITGDAENYKITLGKDKSGG